MFKPTKPFTMTTAQSALTELEKVLVLHAYSSVALANTLPLSDLVENKAEKDDEIIQHLVAHGVEHTRATDLVVGSGWWWVQSKLSDPC